MSSALHAGALTLGSTVRVRLRLLVPVLGSQVFWLASRIAYSGRAASAGTGSGRLRKRA